MKVSYQCHVVTKGGLASHELEDAFWPPPSQGLGDHDQMVCAVADGATQGSHSGPWAEALCKAFVHLGRDLPLKDHDITLGPWLKSLWTEAKKYFDQWEKTYLNTRAQAGRQLAWFEEAVMQSGAFSTLLGVSLVREDHNRYMLNTLAIGDSCLFILREGKVFRSFPIGRSEQFKKSPYLVASDPAKNGGLKTATFLYRESLKTEDSLFLCTDALSCWILQQLEQEQDPGEQLLGLAQGGDDNFKKFICDQRDQQSMRNDDVTFVHIQLLE
jgi:hypothetical protein